MSFIGTLEDLAQHSGEFVSGIPFDLESTDPFATKGGGDYIDYVAKAYTDAMNVMATLYYDAALFNEAATKDAMTDVGDKIAEGASLALSEIASGNLFGIMKAGVTVPLYAMREFISLAFGVATYGAKLHVKATGYAIFKTTEDWREHADKIYRILRAIKVMDDLGALHFLKWQSSFMEDLRISQGYPANVPNPNVKEALGFAPIIGVAIVIAAAVVLIAAIWLWSRRISEMNERAMTILADICTKPDLDDATKKTCIKTLTDPKAPWNKTGLFPGPDLTDIMPYLFGGALIVGAVMFAPQIIKSFREARAEAQKA